MKNELEIVVRRKLVDVEAKLAKGKGTWGTVSYVTDDSWASWHGVRYALGSALHEAGCNEKILSTS